MHDKRIQIQCLSSIKFSANMIVTVLVTFMVVVTSIIVSIIIIIIIIIIISGQVHTGFRWGNLR